MHKPQATGDFTQSGNFYMTPPDLATIYNFNQAFNGGITGKGQTIYLVEDSDIYTNGGTVNDWATFRTGFGIPVANYPGASLTTIHPNCTDPGVNGDDAEAIIDAEYASAAAPSAAIVMAVCNDFVAMLQTMFNNPNTYPPAIMSISYGECEALNGAANNAAFRNVYQTGVAEGWSIFVSAGDQGAGGCNFGGQTVTDGVGVNGLGSTVYNVAVGGTDFGDTFARQNNTYWNSTNTATFGSALSYIPEIPWNTTCGSQLFATFEGFATTYGASGFCNSSFVANTAESILSGELGGLGRPEPVRPRHAFRLRRDQRHLHRMAEAVLAKRLPRQSGRHRARSARRLDVRVVRSLASRLRNLLLRYQPTRRHAVRRHRQLAGAPAGAARRSARRSGPASRR